MEENNDIIINRLAINALDLQSSSPTVSNSIFALDEDHGIIKDFFITHLLETRQGKATKSCKFIDEDATIKTKVSRYESQKSDDEFLKLSKELTENLFKIMKNSSSNSSGTFFVLEVVFKKEPCIFIIKLDPKSGVQINLETLSVQVLENILPDSNDRVHKCAIIKTVHDEDPKVADLFVMDKQQKAGEPARFFIETYLQAQELLNDRIITREVLRRASENIIDIVPEADHHIVMESIDREFTNNSRIDLKNSIKNILEDTVPKEKQDREIFIENSASEFVTDFIEHNKDYQTSFVVTRNDQVVVYRAEKNQVFFRYNRGMTGKIEVSKDTSNNTIIKIDSSLNFSRDVK
ncbi:nucleoid-associated protein [Bacillus pumilus]|uniref:nucleoid-associated protein n=1 Tax=Bacillus pumilus TaxID=1408 RepID=UPI0023DAFBA4|nr:nucleoid-associated protein [Bacillus pumilus]MDF2002718.1 nucleoid-associated protein [Bacillus pumilus]MDF2025708.1 nucleoid-associated protein [Bacillus pumilus]MDF2027600.1 nucleoid-associated protein [Bacillus pumilus]MDF2090594.1 nucleoid-associated protein [Bacillus pumilus]